MIQTSRPVYKRWHQSEDGKRRRHLFDQETDAAVALDIRAMATDTVSALKNQIELASGVLAREQRVFIVKDEETTIYLEDDKLLGDDGISRHWSAPKSQRASRPTTSIGNCAEPMRR